MAPNVICTHLLDKANVGDVMSCPSHYFTFDGEMVSPIDVRELASSPETPKAVILGGGGLLDHDYIRSAVDEIVAKGSPVVAWGVGQNRHTRAFGQWVSDDGWQRVKNLIKRNLEKSGKRAKFDFSDWQPKLEDIAEQTRQFALIGVRDDIPGTTWVPCASCMSPLLDKYRNVTPTRKIVVHEHPMFMGLRISRYPKLPNLEQSFDQTLAFLASARIVVTSSYHGAYWSTLMGRKVVCVPWSTKFFGFRHKPEMSYDLTDLPDRIRSAREYPEALEECRQANLKFASLVSEKLKMGIEPIRGEG